MLVGYIIIKLDHRKLTWKLFKGLLMFPIFMLSWLVINFKCLFKRETTWEKIEHNRNVNIKDVDTESVTRANVDKDKSKSEKE
jgi:hypothetical protein